MYFSFKKIPKSKEMMHELIEKYFEKNLSEEEKIRFDKMLIEDVDFKNEFEFYSELKNAVTVSERQKIKKEIQQFEAIEDKPVFTLKRYFPYAAILLIMVSFWVYFVINRPNNDNLYLTYFEAYPNIEISNTRSEPNEKSVIDDAFIAYDTEDFKKANELFDLALKISNTDYIQFYKAISLMKLNQHKEALKLFEVTNWTTSYKEKSMWFQSLCYLKLNQTKEAKTMLSILSKKYSFKNKEAKELLSKL